MTGVVLLTAANLHVVVLKALPRGESPTSNLRPKNRFNGDGGVKGASQRQVADRELGPEQEEQESIKEGTAGSRGGGAAGTGAGGARADVCEREMLKGDKR